LKPDIVFIDSSTKKIIIIDATIWFENNEETREIQIIDKVQKYDSLRYHLAEKYNEAIDNVVVCPFWFGARGTILKSDVDRFEKLICPIPKAIILQIATIIVSWSASLYNAVVYKRWHSIAFNLFLLHLLSIYAVHLPVFIPMLDIHALSFEW
jgi:hypothetical protein